MGLPRIVYEGMDQNTKNAFVAIQKYVEELETKNSNLERKIETINNGQFTGNTIAWAKEILGSETLLITSNSNNPPTIKAGSRIIYHNGLAEIALNITSDISITFGSNGVIAKTNSTIHYLYVYVDSNNIASYNVSTIAPTYSDTKRNWYNTSGRVLARFYVDGSGNVLSGSICHYKTDLVAELYTTTTNAPSITGLDILKHGGEYQVEALLYFAHPSGGVSLNLDTNGDGATTTNWYSILEYSPSTPAGQNQPLILYISGFTYTANYHQINVNIRYNSGRPWYRSDAAINENIGYYYSSSRGNLRDSASMTNVTTIGFKLTNGTWSAGSDIRIYRSR